MCVELKTGDIYLYIDLSFNYINFINVQVRHTYVKMLNKTLIFAMAWLLGYTGNAHL